MRASIIHWIGILQEGSVSVTGQTTTHLGMKVDRFFRIHHRVARQGESQARHVLKHLLPVTPTKANTGQIMSVWKPEVRLLMTLRCFENTVSLLYPRAPLGTSVSFTIDLWRRA